MGKGKRIAVIGPTYPFRGGIAYYTTLLTRALRDENEVLLISFSRQYPQWLFPGKSDKDPSENPLTTPAEYLIDSLNPLTWLRTLRRLRQFQPDVVVMQWWVSFWTPQWVVLGWGIRALTNAKIKFVVHNALPHEATFIDRFAARAAMQSAHQLIAQSSADGQTLRIFFPQKRVDVTPHPTYAELGATEQNHAALPYPQDKPLLLFCGLIRPYKGLDILLDALPAVLAQHDVHLAIVGEMWQGGASYFEQIDQLGLQDHVTVENEYVANERLAAWVNSAEVVILPYRSVTQSGIAQLSLSLQTPVIATDIGDLSSVIQHDVNGLLVPPDNPPALASAIDAYFRHDTQARMRQALQQHAAQYSWQTLCDFLVDGG